ncbi:APC family permease [Streptomyces sp. NBC_01708]|uniref:APC family permease n=1 Tax=Streptomyces sp. NBC_01708 TaxID=2975915 RepID=UPI002E30F1B7|nr:APC family permease [Streptomyces sp. NBC_01708]
MNRAPSKNYDDEHEQDSGVPRPSDVLPGLDEEQLRVLREAGRRWPRVSTQLESVAQELPVNPDMGEFPAVEDIRPTRFGQLVHITSTAGPSQAEVSDADASRSARTRWAHGARRVMLGAPLRSSAVARESMRKLVALPVLSADALSSVAYGPEAMLAVLVLAGTAGLAYSLPIAAAVAVLMLVVGLSYRQTIRAYPHGGGSYIVASDNLGLLPGLLAAGGLLIDYVLTVAVSIASGIAAVTSAIPSLAPATVPLGLAMIALLLVGNLRGIRQAGVLFAAPTYAFILAMFALITSTLADTATNGFQPAHAPHLNATEGLGVLLVMRAFASGATAMTGIEAISNAVPAFQPVRWRNARTTLTWMTGLLITMFAGIIAIVHLRGIIPRSGETVLSQLAHLTFNSGPMYVFVQAATAAVLLLAANTAYNDFPRVLFLLARDGHAPRLFLRQGDRLAFSNGIALLSVIAALVYVAFNGNTNSLIPLYAVGVFLAFSLSQIGMVVHWRRVRTPHWRKSLAFNATGAMLSTLVLITAAITKFTAGAWVALVAIGLFFLLATRIRRHYQTVGEALRLHPGAAEVPAYRSRSPQLTPAQSTTTTEGGWVGHRTEDVEGEETPQAVHHLSVVALATLDLAGLRALAYAASLQQPTLAVHISPSEEEAQRFRDYWTIWGNHLPLHIVLSPYRAIVAPLIHYIEALHRQRPDLTITVILPEVVTHKLRYRLLHSKDAARLRHALRPLPKIVITSVPFHTP